MSRKPAKKQKAVGAEKEAFSRPDFLEGEFSLPKIGKKFWIFGMAMEFLRNRWRRTRREERGRRRKSSFFSKGRLGERPARHAPYLKQGVQGRHLRYKTMRGYNVPRRAGWDTHGLPVEMAVEKELGFKSKKDIEAYGVEKFNKKSREQVWI